MPKTKDEPVFDALLQQMVYHEHDLPQTQVSRTSGGGGGGSGIGTSYIPATVVIAPLNSVERADYYTNGGNDTTQINLALSSLLTTGGSVFFHAGNYYINDNLLVPSNVTVRGAGMGATIFYMQGSKGFKNYHFSTTGDHNIAISDLTMDAQTIYDVCIQYRGVQTGLIERVQCKNVRSVNLPIASVTIGIVGLIGIETKNITVRNNFLTDCGNYGVNIDPLPTFEVMRDIIVEGNHLYNVQTGVACQRNCENVLITNNVYNYAQGGVCIGFKGCPSSTSNNPGKNIQVTNNIFRNADTTVTSQAISIGNKALHTLVEGNTIENFEVGVYLNVHPEYTNVIGNNIYGSTYGIKDSASAEYTVVTGNSIYNCAEYGIWFNTFIEMISNNLVTTCGKYGIYLQATSDHTIVSNNKVYNNSQSSAGTYSGIYLEDVSDSVIIGNKCLDKQTPQTQKYGIEEAGTSNNNTYIANNCDNNLTGSISMTGTSNEYGYNIGF
jgi:parallel beta-helix repeat protein